MIYTYTISNSSNLIVLVQRMIREKKINRERERLSITSFIFVNDVIDYIFKA